MNDVLTFWFEELSPKDWWVKSDEIDQLIKDRFSLLHQQAIQGELFEWRKSPEGRLAEIIILDQFSRNMFRNNPKSFAYDALALILAQECVALKQDQHLDLQKRKFVYMPYMHSESLKIHQQAILLFSQEGLENNLKFEHAHLDIIKKFGRYPHRNQILGRASSDEEIEFLKLPHSSF